MAKERHKIVPASYLVLMKENKVLLGRRFNTGYEDGKCSLPAGHVDKNENFTQCIIREAKEEIGIDLKLEDLRVAHIMQRDSHEKENGDRVDVFFTAQKWEGDIVNKESHKCDDLSWHDLDNLPENIIPYVQYALNCIKNNVFYSEYGWKQNYDDN